MVNSWEGELKRSVATKEKLCAYNAREADC